jgi:membrane associated rhomboid family serine protease
MGSSVIKPLIWANIAIFLFQSLTNNQLTGFLALHIPALKGLQIWRLGTYMFAHGGLGHIFFNMWGLHLFGRQLEERIGPHRFLNLYFGSGVIGGLAWCLFNWNHPYSSVIGASGAVFGIMIATAMLFPNQQIMLLFPPIPMRLKTFVFGYAAIEIVMALGQGGGRIAHIAHLGGALAGFLYIRHYYGSSSWSPFSALHDYMRQRHQRQAQRQREQFKTHRNDSASSHSAADLAAEVDKVLDKIGREGIESLTPQERKILDTARERLRGR